MESIEYRGDLWKGIHGTMDLFIWDLEQFLSSFNSKYSQIGSLQEQS